MKKLIFLCLSCWLCFQVSAQDSNSLLWKVQSPSGESSYIFGTYHLINDGFLAEKKRVREAYEAAETVVVETVIDSSRLMEFTMKMMMQEQTLSGLLDSSEYALVEKEFERVVGMDLALFNTMKPMAVNSTYIASFYMQNLPEEARFEGQPMDLYFARQAQKRAKEVVALESMAKQADFLFNSQSVEQQAEDLVALLSDHDEALRLSNELTQAYLNEQLPALLRISESSEENYGDMSILLDQRNQNWIPLLTPILNEGDAFIAVGALHLAGEMGILALLREEGFELSPVLPKE